MDFKYVVFPIYSGPIVAITVPSLETTPLTLNLALNFSKDFLFSFLYPILKTT
jgi:hypothetical protein